MKTRLLAETDLANVAALPKDQRRPRLEAIKFIRPPYSYDPSRDVLPDSLNQQFPMLGPQPSSSWVQIAKRIHERSRTDEEEAANLTVSMALHNYVTQRSLTGRQLNIGRMSVGLGVKVAYWASTGLVIDGRMVVPFLDFRKSGLTPGGQLVAFSLMKEHIETRHPDYSDAQFAIIHLTNTVARKPFVHYADTTLLLSYDDLQTRIEETYQLWFQILEERTEEARKKAGSRGSLL